MEISPFISDLGVTFFEENKITHANNKVMRLNWIMIWQVSLNVCAVEMQHMLDCSSLVETGTIPQFGEIENAFNNIQHFCKS